MNKFLFSFSLFFSIFILGQAPKVNNTQRFMINAENAVSKFVGELSETNVFKKYYELDEKESTVVGKFSFNELKSGILDEESIVGYILTFRLKSIYNPVPNTHDLKFVVHLNKDLEVDYSEVWNSDYSPAVQGNLQIKYDELPEEYHKKFIISQLTFADKLEKKKVLKLDQILNYLKQNYPDKKFREVELSRTSWPPYDVHFEVTQENCSNCLHLEFPIDSLEISRKSEIGVSAIN